MRRPAIWLIAALLLLGSWAWQQAERGVALPGSVARAPQAPIAAEAPPLPAFLPDEAHDVLRRIDRGGPFAYRQDGGVFQNRERRLPAQPRGYYREYTVAMPGERDRGARRVITGGEPPTQYWYTDDHYRSFRRFERAAPGQRR